MVNPLANGDTHGVEKETGTLVLNRIPLGDKRQTTKQIAGKEFALPYKWIP